jgi:hypothetical protein
MGILIETDNNYLSTILDIILIFVLGFVLLFFAYTMKTDNKYVIMYVSLIVIGVLLYNTVYLHNNTTNNKKQENVYNVMTFLNIYVMILMVLLSGMSLYITSV